ncbi:MAG: alpha/beta hydrolase [Clostridia bacterium]|nr:alpha/beta hydrolase [Clostridia bacterium]
MKIKLKPDQDIAVQKRRIGRVPTLILRPARRSSVPVSILWIHGGGYVTGMKEMVFMSRAADLVKKYGVTVYSPGYHLAWQKPYPAAVNDCYQVLEYMNKQPDTIMVGGESAGGGLAVAVCMMARDRGIQVAFQMPLYPMISNIDTESSRNNHGKVWNTRRNHFGWRLYLRMDAKKAVSPYAAPAHQTDYTHLPPCYTFVGDGEPFYAETLAYVENLKAAGVEAAVDVYPTDMHAFDMLKDDALSREAVQKFERQFEKALRCKGSKRTHAAICDDASRCD